MTEPKWTPDQLPSPARELYEALQIMLDGFGCDDDYCVFCAPARAALAKARGEDND